MRLLLLLGLLLSGCATSPTIWNHWSLDTAWYSKNVNAKEFTDGATMVIDAALARHILLYHSGCVRRYDTGKLVLICPEEVSVPGHLLGSTLTPPGNGKKVVDR